jgi:hypothetical protein
MDKQTLKKDIIASICFMLFSALWFVESFTFKSMITNTVSARFWPQLCSGIMFAAALYLLVQSVLAYRRLKDDAPEAEAPQKGKAETRRGVLRCAVCFVLMIAAALLIKPLGFIVDMALLMFVLFVLLEEKGKRKYLLYAILSIAFPTVIYFIFRVGFAIYLPAGILDFIL